MQEETTSTPEPSTADPPRSEDLELQHREYEVKLQELAVRKCEAEKALELAKAPWWRRADPLLLAVIAAILTLLGNMLVARINNQTTIDQENVRNNNTLSQEKLKARYSLILQAIGTGDQKIAEQNIKFFIDAGLLEDKDKKIAMALNRFRPVLPTPGTNIQPHIQSQPLEVPEIARIYNFPTQMDGSGQTIGLLEFGGGYRQTELATYFSSAHLPTPQIIDVSVDGQVNAPGAIADGQVELDLEVIGSIAPKAVIRVYFASFTEKGFIDALNQAAADRVSIISVGWGTAESEWKQSEIKSIDTVLRTVAEQGITVIAAAGDGGVSDRVNNGKPHVNFPASSPWVLAVGGTSVVASAHQIRSETVWNDRSIAATGGGVSSIFEQPAWQAAVGGPVKKDGTAGRCIPDVAAIADPSSGALVLIGGIRSGTGGTSLSALVWAGLIALINQDLGHNVGYLNPLLYQQVGPSGILHPITKGDNSFGGVKGYSAGPGWNPVTGWGSPDGTKLLDWFRSRP